MTTDAEIVRAAKLFALAVDLSTLYDLKNYQGESVEVFVRLLDDAIGNSIIPGGLPYAIGNFEGDDFKIILMHYDSERKQWFGYWPANSESYWWNVDEIYLTGETT